jgi:hypothetical protein
MTEAPGGSAGFGHGSDPDEHEALLRRIREFLRHGAAAEAGVEEWGEFAAQLRFLREELPPEERSALLERWDRVLMRALPDLHLDTDQRDNVLLALEAAAAEGAAWAALEDRAPPEQPAGLAPVLRPSVWTADQPAGLPSLRVDAEAGFACTGFSIRGLPAIGIQSSRNDPPLAFLVLDSEQLGELLERARELLGTSA